MVCARSPSYSEGNIDRTAAQIMLYLTCIMISIVDLAHNGVFCATGWVSVDCDTSFSCCPLDLFQSFCIFL